MMFAAKSIGISVLGLTALVAVGCGDETVGGVDVNEARSDKAFVQSPNVPSADYTAFISGTNDFGFDLYRKLPKNDNFVYSPVSTATALAMTYAGARGDTQTQMAAVLHDTLGQAKYHPAYNQLLLDLSARDIGLHDTDQGQKSVKLRLVDAAFAQVGYQFSSSYLDTLAQHYNAGVKLLDYSADPEGSRETINLWVEAQTEQKIKDLLPQGSIRSSTRLVLANALYFYGSWASVFSKDLTQSGTFHAPAGDMSASMMHQTLSAPYAEGDGYQAARLDYDGGQVSMIVVLPAAGKLADIEAGLSDVWLGQLSQSMGQYQGEVQMTLPKFTFTWGTESFADPLKALGMADAFSLPPADFTGMEPQGELFISDVLHQAFVGVDEDGTEAAAATAVVMDNGSVPMDPKVFTADRPFLFFIRDNGTGAVLFIGKVSEPKT